jgi:hypothetical protein
MKGYVTRKRGRYYAVIYEGLDPVTGRERRSWHPAGDDPAVAERLAARFAAERNGRNDEARALTFGAYLTGQWLPGKKLTLATSTYRGYERNITRHILPAIGRVRLRRLRHDHLETLYHQMLTPTAVRPALSPTTVYEVHLVIRGALDDAVRRGSSPATSPWSPRHPGCGRSPRSNSKRGPPRSSRLSCGPPLATACSPRSGWPRPPGCAAANCSACDGPTSTSNTVGCQ